MMTQTQRHTYTGANRRKSLYELTHTPIHQELVVFVHGLGCLASSPRLFHEVWF